MTLNPFRPPGIPEDQDPHLEQDSQIREQHLNPPAEGLRTPATGLIILCIMNFALHISPSIQTWQRLTDTSFEHLVLGSNYLEVFIALFQPLLSVIITAGAVNMIRLRHYPLCFLTAILAATPCISPCLIFGVVFGIWSLVILRRKEVRAAFKS